MLGVQVAAARAPQVLAPRRRKAVNYNEAKLHRKYVTDSESEATVAGAGSDPDDSAAEDGPQIKVCLPFPPRLEISPDNTSQYVSTCLADTKNL